MRFIRTFFIISALVISLSVVGSTTASAASSQQPARTQEANETPIAPVDQNCNSSFLTLPAWYNGISGRVSGSCQVVVRDVRQMVVRIVINITEVILQLVGYAATVFLIIGGYKYLVAAGDPNKMVTAKNTIMNAVIGLIVSLFSVAIVNIITGVFS